MYCKIKFRKKIRNNRVKYFISYIMFKIFKNVLLHEGIKLIHVCL